MSKSLFNITLEQKVLMHEIESMEGELTPEMEASLQITEAELQQKSIAYLEVIRQKEGFNSLIDAEIKRLQQIKKAGNNVIARLNDNLLTASKNIWNLRGRPSKIWDQKKQPGNSRRCKQPTRKIQNYKSY